MSARPSLTVGVASWRNSSQVCVYSDRDRHLGHIVRSADGWLAFDGTHISARGDTFRPLGFFYSAEAAREAVQSATQPFSFRETVI